MNDRTTVRPRETWKPDMRAIAPAVEEMFQIEQRLSDSIGGLLHSLGLAEEDLPAVEVKIALISWDRLDELRSRAAVHQQPKPAVRRRGEGLPLVALYGTLG